MRLIIDYFCILQNLSCSRSIIMNKIRILTVEELNQLIESNLVKINEIDIKTLSCNQNVSIEAAQNLQNGNKIKEINQNRLVTDDSQVAKAGELLSRTVQSFLNQYKDIKFITSVS